MKKYKPEDPGLIVVDEDHVAKPKEISNRELLLRIAKKLGVSIE